MKTEPKEYPIMSFEDLCNTITTENKERLLTDVIMAFSGYLETVERLRKDLPDECKSKTNWQLVEYGFIWVDDGGHKILGANIEFDDAKIEIKYK